MSREIEVPIHVTKAEHIFDYEKEESAGWLIEGQIRMDAVMGFEIKNRGIDSNNTIIYVDYLNVQFRVDKIAQGQLIKLAFPDRDENIFVATLKIPEK